MQLRFSLLFACLLATNFLSASNHPAPQTENFGILSCEIPPPTDFHVLEQGPFMVTFEWVPIMDGAQHRIKTYRTSDNFLLDETILPAGMTKATIKNLPNSTPLYATINSICADGSHGPVSLAIPTTTLILDLIVTGFTSGEQSYCPITSTSIRCEFDGSGPSVKTPFRISNSNASRQFGVMFNGLGMQTSIEPTGNRYQSFKLYCDNFEQPPCGNEETDKITIIHEINSEFSVLAAEFILVRNPATTVGYFQCLSLAPGYQIDRMAQWSAFGGAGGNRSSDSENDFLHQLPTASPNPFSETLDVFPGNPAAENIRLQMYNLSGQKVLDQQFSGGQEQYSLSTASLSTGFYLLRIEADGEVQTLKVVKSE